MSRVAVVFDTNSCYVDRTHQIFLGNKSLLKEISEHATLIIPQIVIDELIQQKIEGTTQNIKELRSNPLLPALGFDLARLDKVVETEHVNQLQVLEDLPYEVIDINDPVKTYSKIREWVIPGNPPFNKRTENGKNNSDKGLKDAFIACSIDELLDLDEYDKYYLACEDGRLKEYYKDNSRISCLKTDEILDLIKKEFFDEYTLDVVNNELEQLQVKYKNSFFNINSDVIGHFEGDENSLLIAFDASSKEIIGTIEKKSITHIDTLAASESYDRTHEVVAEITENIEYYSQSQLKEIKKALLTNDQIYAIGTDEDIKGLASRIFNFFNVSLSDDEKLSFAVYYGLREV